MNVLKPHLQTTVKTLLEKGVSQREINRKTGIDRKTIRKYVQAHQRSCLEHAISNSPTIVHEVATGLEVPSGQNPPPRPPALADRAPKPSHSTCEAHRQWIQTQVKLGRNAMAIYQDLVEQRGFTHQYNSVKRFVRQLKKNDPRQYDRLEFVMGEEAQVDYGLGAPTRTDNGKYRRPRLFVMVLKYSGRAFRKVVWHSSKQIWARLHEEAFRYFGGAVCYVTLDNLKEGVIKPDIYDPHLNVVYAAVLAHYGVSADPARIGDPNRKGTVENAVKHTQNTALKGRTFETIEAQNDWLDHWEQRWASLRIHGRAKRQVEEMFQEEKPFLAPLPLSPFRYFQQEKRKVYDDGTIQVGNCYYAARPAVVDSEVQVRIYDDEIEILDPVRMEVIRRHPKSHRRGSVIMQPADRIFNPSRQTDRLLVRAECIGPHTFALCEQWFNEEGRTGQRRMYGVINLVRRYRASYVEKAAELAKINDIKSARALRRIVETMAAKAEDQKAQASDELTQEHPLIRSGQHYAAFWDRHACQAGSGAEPTTHDTDVIETPAITPEQLPVIWQQANWWRVIEFFHLTVDHTRRRRDHEIWLTSPFTQERTASMHVNLSENIYKDFSSGKGGGIIQFCRDMLSLQGRVMTMFEVAQWMLSEGISTVNKGLWPSPSPPRSEACVEQKVNPAIKIDLRAYLRVDHPELHRRGLSVPTCRYLGCGFLPQRTQAKASSPLNGRIVFQIRGVRQDGDGLEPAILSHTGRALSLEQEQSNGKYWSYPYRKGWELYNQDQVLLDDQAQCQTRQFGLILVEGFFDVAKLVEARCLNVVALMGSSLSEQQITRLKWIRLRVPLPRIVLFLDRDRAGIEGAQKVKERLRRHGLEVSVFDWNQSVRWQDGSTEPIGPSIQDPADMSVDQLCCLRRLRLI